MNFFSKLLFSCQRVIFTRGSGWDDKALPQNVRTLGHVRTSDHNAFNCTARAVLNINRQSMANYGFSPATRVFEAVGAGACLITDFWQGIEQFLEPEQEILVVQDGQQVAQLLQSLTPDRARRIGAAARKEFWQNILIPTALLKLSNYSKRGQGNPILT